jgi:hypothetical protein
MVGWVVGECFSIIGHTLGVGVVVSEGLPGDAIWEWNGGGLDGRSDGHSVGFIVGVWLSRKQLLKLVEHLLDLCGMLFGYGGLVGGFRWWV